MNTAEKIEYIINKLKRELTVVNEKYERNTRSLLKAIKGDDIIHSPAEAIRLFGRDVMLMERYRDLLTETINYMENTEYTQQRRIDTLREDMESFMYDEAFRTLNHQYKLSMNGIKDKSIDDAHKYLYEIIKLAFDNIEK